MSHKKAQKGTKDKVGRGAETASGSAGLLPRMVALGRVQEAQLSVGGEGGCDAV